MFLNLCEDFLGGVVTVFWAVGDYIVNYGAIFIRPDFSVFGLGYGAGLAPNDAPFGAQGYLTRNISSKAILESHISLDRPET